MTGSGRLQSVNALRNEVTAAVRQQQRSKTSMGFQLKIMDLQNEIHIRTDITKRIQIKLKSVPIYFQILIRSS